MLGNQLLVVRDESYPAQEDRKYDIRQYTVDAVAEVVSFLGPPTPEWMMGVPTGIGSSLATFIGYVMLDAWVANQDRHHQNWGAIWQEGSLRLAPTFDHGASLARNISDEERKDRLTTRDRNRSLEAYASKARSGFYSAPSDTKTILALDVFKQFVHWDQDAGRIWLGKLAEISQIAVDAILAEIPPQRMSPVTREFTSKLLMINQRRLLESLGS